MHHQILVKEKHLLGCLTFQNLDLYDCRWLFTIYTLGFLESKVLKYFKGEVEFIQISSDGLLREITNDAIFIFPDEKSFFFSKNWNLRKNHLYPKKS